MVENLQKNEQKIYIFYKEKKHRKKPLVAIEMSLLHIVKRSAESSLSHLSPKMLERTQTKPKF